MMLKVDSVKMQMLPLSSNHRWIKTSQEPRAISMVPKEVLIQVKEVQVAQVVREVPVVQVVQEAKACPPAWDPQAVNSSSEVPLLKVCPLA